MWKAHQGVIFGVFAALTLSVIAILVKKCSEVPPEVLVFTRFFISWLLLLPWMVAHRVHLTWGELPDHLVRGLAGLGSIAGYFYTLSKLPLVNAMVLSSTSALFMPLVVFVWGKFWIPKWRLIAAVIGFAGIIMILRPTNARFEVASLVGLCAGGLSAIALFGVRQLSKKESTLKILAYYFTLSTAVSLLPAIRVWPFDLTGFIWLNLIGIGVLSIVAQYCLTMSFTHTAATKASALTYLGVGFGGIAGWLLWGEVPDLWEIIGLGLVVLGGLLVTLDPEEAKPRR